VLYCFFVVEHERRKILHCNVTQYPTAEWIVQQLREAFPEPCRYRYVILDRDRKFDGEVLAFLAAAGLNAKRTSVRAHRGATARYECEGAVDGAIGVDCITGTLGVRPRRRKARYSGRARTSLHCESPPQMEAVRWFRRPFVRQVTSLQSE